MQRMQLRPAIYPLKNSTKMVWSNGAMAGAFFGLISSAPSILPFLSDSSYINILSTILSIVVVLFAGMLAAKETGQVRRGAQVGLVAGITGLAIISIIGLVLAEPVLTGTMMPHAGTKNMQAVVIETTIAWGIITLAGTIGGLIGKSRYNRKFSSRPRTR